MKKTIVVMAAILSLSLWVATARSGEDKHKHEGCEHHKHGHAHGEQGNVPPYAVEIGPELKHFQRFVGTWKLTHKMWMNPESEAKISTGTEVNELILGGRALSSAFESTGPDGLFKGHGLLTWNVMKQKYQCVWLDVLSRNGFVTTWGTCDPKGENWTWKSEGMMGHDGKMMAMRMTEKMPDKDHRFVVMYVTGPDGKEFKMMEFDYTRVK